MTPVPDSPPLVDALRSRLGAKFGVARPRPAPDGSGRVFDHSIWSGLLAEVSDGWTVDYRAVRERQRELSSYLDALAHANPDALDASGQLAFWINAYNAGVLAAVVDERPTSSVLEIPGVFTRRQIQVGGRGVTPDEIEHGIVRRLGDHRVHFGLNCASIGCPPLRAYVGPDIEGQLDENGRRYLSDSTRGARLEEQTLSLAMVFRWFPGDFAPLKGVPSPLATLVGLLRPRRVLPVARNYLPEEWSEPRDLAFIDWDWRLNAA